MVRSYVADRDMGDVVKFCEKKRANPAVASLTGKLPIVNVDEITPEMLALDAKPTAEEVEAIRALSRDQRECRDRIDMVSKDHWPTQAATRKELALQARSRDRRVAQAILTYGNANRLYQEAALDAEGKLTEERKEQMYLARAVGDRSLAHDRRGHQGHRRRAEARAQRRSVHMGGQVDSIAARTKLALQ